MKKQKTKKVLAMLLAVSLLMPMLPVLPGMSTTVYGAEPKVTQFATKDQLTTNFNLKNDASGTIGRIKFGAGGREWLIAGPDNMDTDNNDDDTLALLSASSFGDSAYGSNSRYFDSTIANNVLPGYLNSTSYFSETEKEYMAGTTVSTADWEGNSSTVTGKLYIPDAQDGRNGWENNTICVGTNNNIPIALSQLNSGNGFTSGFFWLRSPCDSFDSGALLALPGSFVGPDHVHIVNAVVPAFNLNLSSVLFASAAPAASSTGALTIEENAAMTLRYMPATGTSFGTAAINSAQNSVSVSDAPAETYLVVQNGSGAWAKKVSGNKTITASEIDSSLTSFADCKVWLEKTDTERITTAVMAVPRYEVKITNPPDSHITRSTAKGNGAETQIAAQGAAITNVVYTADSGYYFPETYSVEEVNGISVTRKDSTQITVSGAPTANAAITLAAATKQTHTITADPTTLNFGTVNRDDKGSYTQPKTQTVTVRNTGNSAVTLTKPISENYVIGDLSKNTLGAGDTATFTVQPKGDLDAGTYSETLEVKTNEGAKATVALSFTVNAKPKDAPETGDNSRLFLWIILLALSGGGLTILGIRKRHKKNTIN